MMELPNASCDELKAPEAYGASRSEFVAGRSGGSQAELMRVNTQRFPT
jgi:hypothetical protein